jgi:hypothetical protein
MSLSSMRRYRSLATQSGDLTQRQGWLALPVNAGLPLFISHYGSKQLTRERRRQFML